MNSTRKLLLGIDGGGTKTSIWLGRIEEGNELQILAKETGGPGNPRSLGFTVAFENIGNAISMVFEQAGLEQTTVDYACLSLAGAGRASEQARVSQWIESAEVARRHQIVGDAEILLAAAADSHERPQSLTGISLIAGTGSMAWGRNTQGETARAGGWGYLFGDEGSAYAIAADALRAVSQAVESRTMPTSLVAAILEHLRLDTASQLIEWCYGDTDHRQRIASLAPVVFTLYQTDKTARRIISSAANDLAQLVSSVAKNLDFATDEFTLACTGGVLLRQPIYQELLARELRDCHLQPRVTRFVKDAAEGALRIACWNS